jgi:methylmalonyl-CoA mutase, C-terminal domain
MESKKKVLMAKVGLDGHDWGVKVICQAFRNAGMEVIYTGLRQTPELIVVTALDEDVDVIGVSIHSGAHMYHVPRILELLKESKADDMAVIVGGTIPHEDAKELKAMGVRGVFPTDSDMGEAIRLVQGLPPRATH